MKSTFLIFIFILNLIIFNFSIAQKSQIKLIDFKQKEIFDYKITSKTYNFWSNKNRFFPIADTLQYFVDDRNYKGLLNYGLEFSSKDKLDFNFIENYNMYNLNVLVTKCEYNPKDSIIDIQGEITGGWSGKDWKDIKNSVEVFIGQKKDTVNLLYYENRTNPNKVNVLYEGKAIDKFVVLDTFPSFYIKYHVHNKTNYGELRTFNIKSKINKNSILAFGLSYSYSEIFEIGKLVFSTEKRKIFSKKNDKSFDKIIVNNEKHFGEKKQLNEVTFKKLNDFDYYKITEKAEDYILDNNFKKAKKNYNILLENIPNIFARDMHNAVRCNILSKDYKSALKWCEKLVLKGIELNYFNAKIFDNLKKEMAWNAFIKKYPEHNKIYKDGLNTVLIKGIIDLLDDDQTVYVKNSIKRIERSELKETTDVVTEKFISLISKEGFPSEEKIGLQMVNDTTINRSPDYYVLIAHAHQLKTNRLNDLKKIMLKSASKFEYDYQRSNLNSLIFQNCLQIYKGNLYNSKGCNLDEKEVKRITFKFNNKYSFLIMTNFVTIAHDDESNDEKFEKVFYKNYEFVKKITDDLLFYNRDF